jgi:hypothetical protein
MSAEQWRHAQACFQLSEHLIAVFLFYRNNTSMSDHTRAFDPIPPPTNGSMTIAAAGAIGAVIEAGARNLIAEPWRVARIIRGADAMTFDELIAEVARRRGAAAVADLNRAIALAQLGRALESRCFRAAWAQWRGGAE